MDNIRIGTEIHNSFVELSSKKELIYWMVQTGSGPCTTTNSYIITTTGEVSTKAEWWMGKGKFWILENKEAEELSDNMKELIKIIMKLHDGHKATGYGGPYILYDDILLFYKLLKHFNNEQKLLKSLSTDELEKMQDDIKHKTHQISELKKEVKLLEKKLRHKQKIIFSFADKINKYKKNHKINRPIRKYKLSYF